MERQIFLSLDDLLEFKWLFNGVQPGPLDEIRGKTVNVFAPRIVGEQSLTAFWEDIAPRLKDALDIEVDKVVTRNDIHEVLKKAPRRLVQKNLNLDALRPTTLFQNYIRALPKANGHYTLYADALLEYAGLYINGNDVAIVKIISV